MVRSLRHWLGRPLCVSLSALAVLAISSERGWAGICGIPAPLLGVTGPYGLLAAGVALWRLPSLHAVEEPRLTSNSSFRARPAGAGLPTVACFDARAV